MRKIFMILPASMLLLASCKKNKDDIKQPAPLSNEAVVAATATPQTLTAKFSYTAQDPINIFENQSISFTNLSTGFVKQVWEFGNATKTQEKNPIKSYPMHGYYTVKLTVWDAQGNEQVTTQDVSILCLFANGIHPVAAGG